MLFGGREDVEYAAAHGHVAPLLDQFGPRVPDLDEPDHQVFEIGGLARAQPDRLERAEAADHRLEQAAHGSGHYR